MQGWDWRRWTGVIGFVWVVVQVVAVVLYLVAGNPPDFGDAKKFTGWINTNSSLLMWDAFLTGIATLPLLVLFVGLRSIIRSAGEAWEWAATLFYGAGTVTIAVLIVGSAAEATSAFVSGSGTEPAVSACRRRSVPKRGGGGDRFRAGFRRFTPYAKNIGDWTSGSGAGRSMTGRW